MIEKPKIGEILLQAGVIDEEQLKSALGQQRRWGGRLGIALIKLGFLTERDLVRGLASQLELPIADLEGKRIPRSVLELVPFDYAERFTCLPLFVKEELGIMTLFLGMDDPLNLDVIDNLSFRIGMPVRPVVVAPSELNEGIDRFYRDLDENQGFVKPRESAPVDEIPESRDHQLEMHSDGVSVTSHTATSHQSPSAPISKSSASLNNPSESPTRLILRALIQILVEKDLVDSDELFARVQVLQAEEEED